MKIAHLLFRIFIIYSMSWIMFLLFFISLATCGIHHFYDHKILPCQALKLYPVNTRYPTNAGLMLVHCPRRWPTLKQHC